MRMTQVIQAACPHCRQVLRIPAEWASLPLKCKHCQQMFQARPRSAEKAPSTRPSRWAGAVLLLGLSSLLTVAAFFLFSWMQGKSASPGQDKSTVVTWQMKSEPGSPLPEKVPAKPEEKTVSREKAPPLPEEKAGE